MEDFKQIPLHAPNNTNPTMLENVADIKMINTPTEVDHYQLFRVIDVYVSPKGEDLGALSAGRSKHHQANQTSAKCPRRDARLGGIHAAVVPELRHWACCWPSSSSISS